MAGIKYIFNPSIKKAFCNKMITHDGSEHLYEHRPENGADFVGDCYQNCNQLESHNLMVALILTYYLS